MSRSSFAVLKRAKPVGSVARSECSVQKVDKEGSNRASVVPGRLAALRTYEEYEVTSLYVAMDLLKPDQSLFNFGNM